MTTEDILRLAAQAEAGDPRAPHPHDRPQPNVAQALLTLAGRMGRVPGWDGFDTQEQPVFSHAIGLARAHRMATRDQAPARTGGDSD